MKHRFRRVISALSAVALMGYAVPMAVFAEETAEEISDDVTLETSFDVLNAPAPMVLATATENTISRGEWIHDLVDVFQMSVEDDSTMEYYYTDISNNQYANDINLAANYGVFDVESDTFNPEQPVTREFAAHTANYCMSYLNDGTSVYFSDSDSIYYEYDAVVAVQRGWFELSSDKFEPEKAATTSEVNTILKDARNSVENISIDANAQNIINYSNSVIQLDDSVNASYFDGAVTVLGTNTAVKNGSVFSVVIDGVSHVYQAESVTKSGGNTIIKVADVSFENIVNGIDIQGYGDVDYDNAVFYGTSASAGATSKVQFKPHIEGVQSQLVQAVNIKNDTISIDETIDMGGASLKLNGTLKNIKPEYKLQYDGLSVDSFYFNVDADADISCTLTGKLVNETSSKEIEIGKVPVTCGGVISSNIVISVSVSITGYISLKYSWDVSGGVSYTKADGWRTTKNFKKKGFSVNASGSEKIALKGALDAEVLGWKIGEIYVMGGEKGTFTHVPRTDAGVNCDNLKVYAFAEFGASLNLFDIVKFSQSYEFINYDNSPLRYNKHWENGVEVTECSFDKSATSTKAIRTYNKAPSYVNYSSYGTEFDDVFSLVAGDTEEQNSYQTWTESRQLETNVTVDGDLYLKDGYIDLNGHTLTVKGNLVQTGGAISINNGNLNIRKNYTISGDGYLDMGDGGTVNVTNDFTMKSTKSYDYWNFRPFKSGTLSIGGNFYQYIADTTTANFVSTGTIIKFTGLKTHEVYFDTTSSYLNDVLVEGGGKIKFTGMFHGFPLKCDITLEGDTQLDAGYLQLNGHKLTVEGNLIQKNESEDIDLYNSTLQINGNYEIKSGNLLNRGEKNATLLVGEQLIAEGGSIDLGKITANISSDMLQTDGIISVNGGILNVSKNCTISGDGYLDMGDSNDSSVNINGNFTMKSTRSYDYWNFRPFKAGTLSIGGDFYQYIADTTTANFVSTGTVVKFIGAGTHEFYSESQDTKLEKLELSYGTTVVFVDSLNNMIINNVNFESSKPMILSVNKGGSITANSEGTAVLTMSSNGETSTITVKVSGKPEQGDTNLDGKLSVLDVIILQKYLHNKQQFTKVQYEVSDMNGDSKVNVFDLALLKRQLLKK